MAQKSLSGKTISRETKQQRQRKREVWAKGSGYSNDNPTIAESDYERGYMTRKECGLPQEQSHRCAAGNCQLDRDQDRGQNRVSASRADPDWPYDDTTSALAYILHTFIYNCMCVCAIKAVT